MSSGRPLPRAGNFLATSSVERAASVDSAADEFGVVAPVDFVRAVAHLGPDQLVQAMHAAVDAAMASADADDPGVVVLAAPSGRQSPEQPSVPPEQAAWHPRAPIVGIAHPQPFVAIASSAIPQLPPRPFVAAAPSPAVLLLPNPSVPGGPPLRIAVPQTSDGLVSIHQLQMALGSPAAIEYLHHGAVPGTAGGGGQRSPSATSSASSGMAPTPAEAAPVHAQLKRSHRLHSRRAQVAAAGGGGGGGGGAWPPTPVVAAASEDLRDLAVVEGAAPGVIGVPPRSPRGAYASTPSYWGGSSGTTPAAHSPSSRRRAAGAPTYGSEIAYAARGEAGGGGGGGVSAMAPRVGLATPPVPRPDLPSEEEEIEARRRILGGDAASDGGRGRGGSSGAVDLERQWRGDLRRRVGALSEYYRRQFATTTPATHAGSGDVPDTPPLSRDDAAADDDRGGSAPTTPPPRHLQPLAQQAPVVGLPLSGPSDAAPADDAALRVGLARGELRAPLTPSETVHKSRALRMAAADHDIIAASPALVAALEGRPRVRSPFGAPLLSVADLDHFVPAVRRTAVAEELDSPSRRADQVALRGNAAIERALHDGAVAVAEMAMRRLDRRTGAAPGMYTETPPHDFPLAKASAELRAAAAAAPRPPSPQSRRHAAATPTTTTTFAGRVADAQSLVLPLERSRGGVGAGASAVGASDALLSSPQLAATLERILRQREELAVAAATPPPRMPEQGDAGDRRALLFS
jgi:hypothetical protein